MNTKIPVKKLSDRIAISINEPADEVQSFIKILFDTVADKLNKGERVTIPGLGDFIASSNPDEPVAFIPSSDFADTVNAPFAMFEPMPLNEGVTEEVLNKAVVTDDDEKSQSVPEIEEPVKESVVEETGNEVVSSEKDSTTDTSSVNIVPAEETIVEEIITTAPVAGNMPATEHSDSAVTEASKLNNEPDTLTESTTDVPPAKTVDSEDDTLFIPEDEEEYVVTEEPEKPRFMQGFVVGLITGLAIGALVLFAYMVYFINTPVPPVE